MNLQLAGIGNIKFFLVILLLFFTHFSALAQKQNENHSAKLAVIVNKNNDISSLSKTDLKRIFLKKRKVWPQGKFSGEIIHVINQPYSRNITEQFCKVLLSENINNIKRYWTEQKYKGGELHPVIEHNTQRVIKSIIKDKLSISYVASSPGLKNNPNIRILAEFEIRQSKPEQEALLLLSSLEYAKNLKKSIAVLIIGDDEMADAFNSFEGLNIEGIKLNKVISASTLPKEKPDVLFVGKNSSISALLKYAAKNQLLTMTNSEKIYALGTNLAVKTQGRRILLKHKNLNGIIWKDNFTGLSREIQ